MYCPLLNEGDGLRRTKGVKKSNGKAQSTLHSMGRLRVSRKKTNQKKNKGAMYSVEVSDKAGTKQTLVHFNQALHGAQ